MDYVATVLSGIFPSNRKNLLYAVNRLSDVHMSANPQVSFLWKLTLAYFDRYSDVPTPNIVKDALEKRLEPGEATLAWQVYLGAHNANVTESEFKYAVDGLLDRETHHRTGEAMAIAYEIMTSGYTLDGENKQGHEATREFLEQRLAEIDRLGLADAAPEGDLRLETDQLLKDYFDRKNSSTGAGILTGIPSIDKPSGGIMQGDLAMLAAYTSQGKSQLCVSMAWNAAIMQKKNVYYATSETSRSDIINRLVARHSKMPKFNFAEGLNHSKIRKGELNKDEEKVLRDVLDDLKSGDYGAIEVQQLERGATLNQLEHRMQAKHSDIGIDIAFCDYLNLLAPTTRRTTQREEASDLIKDAKTLATSFGGSGIPFVTPWQVSRMAWEKAQSQQGYDLSALAEASEAEKSADLVITLLYDYKLSPKTATAQLIKCRNGELVPKINLSVDYSCAYFHESGGDHASQSNVIGITTGMPGLTSNYA